MSVIKPLIIFLDLDGVFKTGRSILARMRFDPLISKLVNDLCRLPGTQVVISATCRLNFKSHERELAQSFWRDLGMPDLNLHEDWYTNRNSDARPLEIQEWLERHMDEHHDVEYLFIDDELPAYHEGIHDWALTIIKQGWLLIAGYYNGANYNQLRTLRDMFDERKEAYEKAALPFESGEAAGIIETRKVAESTRRLGSIRTQAEDAGTSGDLPSISADAQLGFKGIHESSIGLISVRQHVAVCREEGCVVCDARFDPRTLVPGFESQPIPERADDAAAHAQAEEAQRGYEGS